jgi:hypothetical protein
MHRIVRAAPFLLFFLVVGCSDSTGPASLNLNRLRWERQNLHDYMYLAERFCFCAPVGPVYVTVKADTVYSAQAALTGVSLPRTEWLTVEQLFDVAERSFGEKDKRVRVEYDPALGYPKLVEVSCPAIADCGFTFTAKNLGDPVIH